MTFAQRRIFQNESPSLSDPCTQRNLSLAQSVCCQKIS